MRRRQLNKADLVSTNYCLGDLGRIVTGRTPPSGNPEYFGSDYPFLTPTDMDERKVARTTLRYLSDAGFSLLQSIAVPPKSVAVSCIGWQMGKVMLTGTTCVTNQQLNTIVPDEKKVDPDFLYYSLSLRRKEFQRLGSVGVRTPILNKSSFGALRIALPPLAHQRSISSALSDYDDVIENNTRRIKILEQMAQMLYREWFVNFRFPGHEKATMTPCELGMIPTGWELKRMDEIAQVIDCLHSKKPEKVDNGTGLLLQLFNIGANGVLDLSKKFLIADSIYKLWTSRIEVGTGDCVITNVGRIAAVAQIPEGLHAALGRNMTAIRPQRIGPTFLIEYLLSPLMASEVAKKKDAGTIMDSLNVKGIVRLSVPIPPSSLIHRFEEIARPMRREIEVLVAKNLNLRATRDLLLPKLISGEISVEQVESEAIAQNV